jgi:ABC-2 type transport system permease protein
MKAAVSIARREVLSFFVSPVAYIVITLFVLLSGFFFFQYLLRFNMIINFYAQMPYQPQGVSPNLNQYVVEVFYQTLALLLVFLIPILTMRLIAEERKSGTFELLATSPLSVLEIVLGKFIGVAVVVGVMLALASVFPTMLVFFAEPAPEMGPVLSGFVGLLLLGWAFASIGMAASAFTENQIVAAITGVVTLLLLYVIYSPGSAQGSWVEALLRHLSPVMQLEDLTKGVISTQSCLYFFSLIALGFFVSLRALELQRWR